MITMKKMKSILITALMLLTAVQSVQADKDVKAVIRSWDEEHKVVKEETIVQSARPIEHRFLRDRWYYVEGNVTMDKLIVEGKAKIVLTDGCHLKVINGIDLKPYHGDPRYPEPTRLFIYSQSSGENEGRMTVTANERGRAGIGGERNTNMGYLEVHGGIINVQGAKHGPGIGPGHVFYVNDGYNQNEITGKFTIFGGTVTATGGECGAGIGGGAGYSSVGVRGLQYIQYGGTVYAHGGELAAGVGGGGSYQEVLRNIGGVGGSVGPTRIYGGKLFATGGHRGAGIGSGSCCPNAYETESKDYPINSMKSLNGEATVVIEGGIVSASGGDYAAGIGGGCNVQGVATYIKGGEVMAVGGKDAAGIGGGEDGPGQLVEITGGKVRAVGCANGAGIGGGDDALGGTVRLLGGTIEAKAGDTCDGMIAKGGSAIGCGKGQGAKDNNGSNLLEIGDTLKVKAGASEDNIDRLFTSPERIAACHWRTYAKVEPCEHAQEAVIYTQIDNLKHMRSCKNCNYSIEEQHQIGDCPCGYHKGTYTITYHLPLVRLLGLFYDPALNQTVKVGQGYNTILQECKEIPEGTEFAGWYITTKEENIIPILTEKTSGLKDAGAEIKVDANLHAYARLRVLYNEKWEWSADKKSCKLTLTPTNPAIPTNEVTLDATVRTETRAASASERGYTLHFATVDYMGVTWVDRQYDYVTYTLKLKDDDIDSFGELSTACVHGQTINVDYERKLSAEQQPDGTWKPKAYTVFLPYDKLLSENETEYSDQVSVFSLKNIDIEKQEMIFTNDFPILKAGSAYLVIVNKGTIDLSAEEVNILEGGRLSLDPVYNPDGSQKLGVWRGAFFLMPSYMLAYHNAYIMQDDGTFKKVVDSGNESLSSLRAYFSSDNPLDVSQFKVKLVVISDGEDGEKEIDYNGLFDDDDNSDDPSPISEGEDWVLDIDEIPQTHQNSDVYYDLQGRRIEGKPAKHGMYIRNGKKVVIR